MGGIGTGQDSMQSADDHFDSMFGDAAQQLLDAGNGPVNGDNLNEDGGIPSGQEPAANEPPASDPEPPATPETPPATPAAPADAPADVPPVTPEAANYEGISGGLIKSAADITRISSEYVANKAELERLREQAAVDPFANDFVKTLNQMQKDGKSPDQVKAFIELQDLGDISKLSPLDAMIKAKGLRDGRDADIARAQIEKKYGITEGMEEMDRKVAEANMADDAKADYEYLQSMKKELAAPIVSTPPPVVNQLSREAIISQVAPIKEKVKEQFKSLGEFDLLGKGLKDGKPAEGSILYDLPIPAEFRDKIPGIVESFFVESGLPVNQENLKQALGVVNYELFNQNGMQVIQMACNAAVAETTKRLTEQYENANGLEKGKMLPKRVNADDLTDADIEDMIRG